MDFERDISTIPNRGVDAPVEVNTVGHYVLSTIALSRGPPCAHRGPNLAAIYFVWALSQERLDLSNGGLHLPFTEDGPFRSVPPEDFSARTAVALENTRDGGASDPQKVISKLRANWGHASARQLRRVMADSESGNSYLADYVDEVLKYCETCRALDTAPHETIAGASTASVFNEEAQVGLLFLGDIIALCAMDLFPNFHFFSQYSPRTHRRSGAFSVVVGWAFLARPRAFGWVRGANGMNQMRTNLRAGRRTELQFQRVGAHPWLSKRRNGFARGIHNSLIEDGRVSNGQILRVLQWCMNAIISAGGSSAYQLVFGSTLAGLVSWGDNDEDPMFTKDTSVAGQFVQQWMLRTRAQGAALKEVANRNFRHKPCN